MRVVGGKLRGKRLGHFKGFDIRPTTDRVREALFNLLATRVALSGSRVLDLFAGTGAVGIEALSRGAVFTCFVDSDPKAISIIEKNLSACGLEEPALVLKRDVKLAVRGMARRGESFGLIFLDPPYGSSLLAGVIALIASTALLSAGGVLVAEASGKAPLIFDGVEAVTGTETGSLRIDEIRPYGDSALYLFSNIKGSGEALTALP